MPCVDVPEELRPGKEAQLVLILVSTITVIYLVIVEIVTRYAAPPGMLAFFWRRVRGISGKAVLCTLIGVPMYFLMLTAFVRVLCDVVWALSFVPSHWLLVLSLVIPGVASV